MAIPELFILVPALLGLKGNLDMTLASRLCTQANLGNMVSGKEIIHMVVGNIALVQVQATVAAFIVSMFSLGVGFAIHPNRAFNFDHALLLTASSMFTATTSCFVLGESDKKLHNILSHFSVCFAIDMSFKSCNKVQRFSR